ncbi:alpha beta hydrolase [Fusarium heterosporum]|uniref:Alpha beta hydrolase n=1 Tax=Fusarium heterosporum TaxID=42747 RepID=A0A8H5TV74_FUSHE|nr:alpha beta hydrolase [Fusarium heterosporum]
MENFPDKIATLTDGRRVSYAVYGTQDNDAPTFFYFHGFPGSHHEAYVTNNAALKHGVRVIAPTRPGYGDSTFQDNRSILDYPRDVLELADILSVRSFAILGVSGGGPYAIACLKDLPRDRLVGVGTVAGVMPMSFSTQGMLAMTRIMFAVAPYATGTLGWIVDKLLGNVARDIEHPEKLEGMMEKDIGSRSSSDKEAWTNNSDFRTGMTRSTREAMKQGGYATAWEARLYGSDWGFELEDVKVREGHMILWHGDQDVNVPLSVSEKAVKMLPGAELRVMEGESHMSLMTRAEEFTVAIKEMLSR